MSLVALAETSSAPRGHFRRALAGVTMAATLLFSPLVSAQDAPKSFADLANRLLPAVVNISTSQKVEGGGSQMEMPQFPPGSPFEEFFKDFFERQQRNHGGGGNGGGGDESEGGGDDSAKRATSLGSGFIIDGKEGLVVTNNHVIADSDEVTVILQDDTNLKAEIVGVDEKTDIALLRVKTERPLPQVAFGDSDASRVGDWVLAIGNPFGLGGTVTQGIISARQRDINAGPYDDFLQTDASINRGNSGGPMFNMNGDVIGVNTAIYSPSGGSVGIGFAIPSNIVKSVVHQLSEYGRTRRGWVGVRIQRVTPEIAENLGLPKAEGALVASVTPDGPADKGGLKAGDVVLTFDGKTIEDMRRLPRVVAETAIDQSVPVEVWRGGKKISATVAVGELEAAEKAGLMDASEKSTDSKGPDVATQSIEKLGLTVAGITDEMREKYSLDADIKGVLVTEVKSGSAAAEKAMRPGDVIVEVNQQAVSSPDDIAKRVKDAQADGKKNVLLLVNSNKDMRWVALKL